MREVGVRDAAQFCEMSPQPRLQGLIAVNGHGRPRRFAILPVDEMAAAYANTAASSQPAMASRMLATRSSIVSP